MIIVNSWFESSLWLNQRKGSKGTFYLSPFFESASKGDKKFSFKSARVPCILNPRIWWSNKSSLSRTNYSIPRKTGEEKSFWICARIFLIALDFFHFAFLLWFHSINRNRLGGYLLLKQIFDWQIPWIQSLPCIVLVGGLSMICISLCRYILIGRRKLQNVLTVTSLE